MLRSLAVALLPLAAAPALAEAPGSLSPLTATGRAALDTGIEIAAAALANALLTSRDAAWAQGTEPMPPQIRAALLAWFPAELLDSVEYRVGAAEDGSVQSLSLRYGDARAVALIDTIVFATPADSGDIALWAHEVMHVDQFRRWGLLGFARRYVRDHTAVEAEAYAIGARVKTALGGG